MIRDAYASRVVFADAVRSQVRSNELLRWAILEVWRFRHQRHRRLPHFLPGSAQYGLPRALSLTGGGCAALGDRRHKHRWDKSQSPLWCRPRSIRTADGERQSNEGMGLYIPFVQ